MPTPVFEFDLNPNTNAPMQDLAWDPWTWEVFCGQFTGGTIYPPGDGTGTNRSDPAALTEYDWNSGNEVARHNEPKDTGYLGPGTRWEPEGMTIARTAPDQIRVLWGVARGPTSNREFLIYSFAYPLKTS